MPLAVLTGVVVAGCSGASLVTSATPTGDPSVRSPSLWPVPQQSPAGPLHIAGNLLVDRGGAAVILRGAQIQSYNVAAAYRTTSWLSAAAFSTMHAWGMNELRLPFSGCLVTADSGYLPHLIDLAQQAEQGGLYVVLALFDDARAGCSADGISLPRLDALEQWALVAAAFHSDPNVLFDLFNEPSLGQGPPTASAWNVWAHGGVVAGATGQRVSVVGLDQLAGAVRSAGAVTQPLVAEAMNGNLTGVSRYLVTDTNVVYSIHTYFQGDLSARRWDPLFGSEAATLPVFVGEWAFLPNAPDAAKCADLNLTTASATSLIKRFLAYMDAHRVSYNAWSFTPTHLIVDEAGFVPTTLPNPLVCSPSSTTAGIGALYKSHLVALAST